MPLSLPDHLVVTNRCRVVKNRPSESSCQKSPKRIVLSKIAAMPRFLTRCQDSCQKSQDSCVNTPTAPPRPDSLRSHSFRPARVSNAPMPHIVFQTQLCTRSRPSPHNCFCAPKFRAPISRATCLPHFPIARGEGARALRGGRRRACCGLGVPAKKHTTERLCRIDAHSRPANTPPRPLPPRPRARPPDNGRKQTRDPSHEFVFAHCLEGARAGAVRGVGRGWG